MGESQVNNIDVHHDDIFAIGDESTWGERLLSNLMSYSLILVPIAVIIIATRYNLCPGSVRNHPLIQWFVYGRNGPHLKRLSTIDEEDEDDKFILDEKHRPDKNVKSEERLSSTFAFIWCLVGLQISYLIWGFLQEKIMTTKYEINLESSSPTEEKSILFIERNGKKIAFITFHDSQFLVFINRVVAFILAILALVYTSRRHESNSPTHRASHHHHNQTTKLNAPLFEYIYSSLSNILSSWCQYEALKYVNFPTQCLSKSCKVIPVMLMSKLLLKKKYQLFDYVCAALLALGMFIFLVYQPIELKQHHNHNVDDITAGTDMANNLNFHNRTKDKIDALKLPVGTGSMMMSGLAILALYLTFDSFTSNWQQSLYTRYQISNWQMMAAINFYSILLTLTSLHQLGNLEPAFKLLSMSNSLMRDCLLMSIMSAVGQMFVYYTIKRFGSVIFAVIMTLRQFFSILLSCLIYGHLLTLGSTGGLLLVFAVVGYQTWHKSKQQTRKTKSSGNSSSSSSSSNITMKNIISSSSKLIDSTVNNAQTKPLL